MSQTIKSATYQTGKWRLKETKKQRTWKKPNQKTSIQQVEYTFTLIKERCQPLLMVHFEAESPLFP